MYNVLFLAMHWNTSFRRKAFFFCFTNSFVARTKLGGRGIVRLLTSDSPSPMPVKKTCQGSCSLSWLSDGSFSSSHSSEFPSAENCLWLSELADHWVEQSEHNYSETLGTVLRDRWLWTMPENDDKTFRLLHTRASFYLFLFNHCSCSTFVLSHLLFIVSQ